MNRLNVKLFRALGTTLFLSFDRIKILMGILLAIVTVTLCVLAGISLFKTCVFVLAFLLLSLIKVECAAKTSKILTSIWVIGVLPASLILTQLMMNCNVDLGVLRVALGLVCCGIILIIDLLLSWNHRTAVTGCMVSLLLLTTINYFVLDFRGCELAPADLLAFGTAMDVAGQYTYSLTAPFVYAWVIGSVYCFCGWCIPKLTVKRTIKGTMVLAFIECALIFTLGFGVQYIVPQHFAQSGSVINGFLLNFVSKYESSKVEKPVSYSYEQIKIYEEQYANESGHIDGNTQPNIIMIMCETFSDLRTLGVLNTTEEVMPFYDSLSVNTVRGHALASVFGGGTGNSEYEVLSGNSMAFFPDSSYPYQQYLKGQNWSLVSYLENLGYHTIATHPENGGNWMRTSAYQALGFDEMYFIEDYPQEKLLRGHVSDQEMYEQMIKWYEEKSGDDPLFMLGVTMQNHSDYRYQGSDFTETVHLDGYSKEYPDVNQYLTLLQHSDSALEYLINYFDAIEDDVIIVFWGDHFPKIDSAFYEEIHGENYDSLDEQMLRYMVPFCIWTNYDIQEQYVEMTSLNFLSNYMLDVAGLPLSPYHQYLSDFKDIVPAINSYGYYSNEKKAFVPLDCAENDEAKWLSQYEELQYNSLFDTEYRSKVFFQKIRS